MKGEIFMDQNEDNNLNNQQSFNIKFNIDANESNRTIPTT